MAIGIVKLSQSGRNRFAIIFIVLNIIQALLGSGIIGTSIYIFVTVSPIVHSEKPEVNFVFMTFAIFGINVLLNWLVGIKICEKCVKQAHKKSTRSLLLLWTCVGTNTVVMLIIITSMSRKVNKHIIKSMKNSFQNGMSSYLTDLSWKETIDELQYKLECCGVDSYEDWHEIEWLTKYIVDEKASLVKDLRTSESSIHLPITPWSCCKVDFPMQCLHDPVQQSLYTHVWVDEPTIVKDSLNTNGCLKTLKQPINISIIIFQLVTTAVTIVHVVIFFVSRILYTSSRNAILLNDPEGVAPGWIFGRGDCGYKRGKSLSEIMLGYKPVKTDENMTRDSKDVANVDQNETENKLDVTLDMEEEMDKMEQEEKA